MTPNSPKLEENPPVALLDLARAVDEATTRAVRHGIRMVKTGWHMAKELGEIAADEFPLVVIAAPFFLTVTTALSAGAIFYIAQRELSLEYKSECYHRAPEESEVKALCMVGEKVGLPTHKDYLVELEEWQQEYLAQRIPELQGACRDKLETLHTIECEDFNVDAIPDRLTYLGSGGSEDVTYDLQTGKTIGD